MKFVLLLIWKILLIFLEFFKLFLQKIYKIPTSTLMVFIFDRRDRLHKLGGGLLVYITDHINFKRRNDIEIEDLESIWLQINFPNNKPILLNFVYRFVKIRTINSCRIYQFRLYFTWEL